MSSSLFGLDIIRYRRYIQLPPNETFNTLPSLLIKDLSLIHHFIRKEFPKSHKFIKPILKKIYLQSKQCYGTTHHLQIYLREDAEINRCGLEDLEPMTTSIKRFFSRFRGLFLVTLHLMVEIKHTLGKHRKFRKSKEGQISLSKFPEDHISSLFPYRKKFREMSLKFSNLLRIFRFALMIESLHRKEHVHKFARYRRCYGFFFTNEFQIPDSKFIDREHYRTVFSQFNSLSWDPFVNRVCEGIIRFFTAFYKLQIRNKKEVLVKPFDPSEKFSGRMVIPDVSSFRVFRVFMLSRSMTIDEVGEFMSEYLSKDDGLRFKSTAYTFLNLTEDSLVTRMKTEWPSLSVPVSRYLEVPVPVIFEGGRIEKKNKINPALKEYRGKRARDGAVKLSDFKFFANIILRRTKLSGRFRNIHVRLVCPFKIPKKYLGKTTTSNFMNHRNTIIVFEQVEDFSKIKGLKRRISSSSRKFLGKKKTNLMCLDDKECLSSTIIFYVHGGGYIGGSTHTSEPFIRWFSSMTNCAVFSAEYHCAPITHYPIPVLQCFLAYRFVVENAENILGRKIHRVFVMGDSAGGGLATALTNLCIATSQDFHSNPYTSTLSDRSRSSSRSSRSGRGTRSNKGVNQKKKVNMSVPSMAMNRMMRNKKNLGSGVVNLRTKIPTALILFYPSLYVSGDGSPSRILSFQDPILSAQFLALCLESYPHPKYSKREYHYSNRKDPFISPIVTPRKVFPYYPPVYMTTTPLCPLFDETICFAKSLDRHNFGMVKLRILEGIHHGWMTSSDEPAKEFPKECIDEVKNIVGWMKLVNTRFVKKGGKDHFRRVFQLDNMK